MDADEDTPTCRLRQFRCVYPSCPSSRTNKRNNIERHVWTQHLRIKLKMPEVRYFARTFKHYVDPYVQEVKDGRIRQRGRRAKGVSSAEPGSAAADGVQGTTSSHSSVSQKHLSVDFTDNSAMESDSDEDSGENSPQASSTSRSSEYQHDIPVAYDTPGSVSASTANTSRRGSFCELKSQQPTRMHYQFHHYQFKCRQVPSRASTHTKSTQETTGTIHRTNSASTCSTETPRHTSDVSMPYDGSNSSTITMYGQKMPFPPVGSSLIPIPINDMPSHASRLPIRSTQATSSNDQHDPSPFNGPLAPLLLALQTLDAAERAHRYDPGMAATACAPTTSRSSADVAVGSRLDEPRPDLSNPSSCPTESMWRPWERSVARHSA